MNIPFEHRNTMRNQVKGKSHAIVRYDLGKSLDHEDDLTAIAINSHSGWLASADTTGLIKIWNH